MQLECVRLAAATWRRFAVEQRMTVDWITRSRAFWTSPVQPSLSVGLLATLLGGADSPIAAVASPSLPDLTDGVDLLVPRQTVLSLL